MFDEPVVFIDIETSGGSPVKAKIIEIGAIRVEGGVVVDQFKTFVNPGAPIPYWITKVTSITDGDVVQAPYFEEVAYQLHTILDGAVFIAHNVRFDYSFIKRQLEACGYPCKPKLLCTVRLSRALYPEAQGHSLEKIIKRHGIQVAARHRAYDDALAIKDFSELAYREHGPEAFRATVTKQFKTQTLPPNLQGTTLQNIVNTTGVYIFEDEAGRPLYVGKSKQLRNRLLSHFREDVINGKEMKLSQGVHHIRTVETTTELEALLLESKMVKELLPLHNRQLRRQSELTIVVKTIDANGYVQLKVESVKTIDPDRLPSVYGVYTSQRKAKAALETKLRTYDLCPKLMGLEKTNRACFAYQLGKCSGACAGREAAGSYNQRLETAMQRARIENWPYDGAISIKDSQNSSLVVDRWIIIGQKTKAGFTALPGLFDVDTYRILRSYINRYRDSVTIQPITI